MAALTGLMKQWIWAWGREADLSAFTLRNRTGVHARELTYTRNHHRDLKAFFALVVIMIEVQEYSVMFLNVLQ